MKRLLKYYVDHWKVAMLTFEIFWIIIFVIHAAAESSATQIPQFVYANF